MKQFQITFGGKWSPQFPHPSGGHRDGWFTIEADSEEQAREAAEKVTDGGYAGYYFDGALEQQYFPAGELRRFKASDILNPPSDPAAPLTVEELCKNLLAIKPGDPFECRPAVDVPHNNWFLNQTYDAPVKAVRQGYDVRPLPVKKFVLLYQSAEPPSGLIHSDNRTFFPIRFRDCPAKQSVHIKAVLVESSSVTAAAALAAAQPGETFLAAVPYPEAQ